MIHKEFAEISDELIRMKEMDYYKFHSFLNGLQTLYERYEKMEDDETREKVLAFAKSSIELFIEVYGKNKWPEDLRKKAQSMIITRNWHFN